MRQASAPPLHQRLAGLFGGHAMRRLTQQGFFHLLSANFLVQFLGFGTILLIPRFVTPTELGQLKIFQDYTAFFLILAGFGLNNSVLKLCSERRPLAERAFFLRTALWLGLLTSGLAYALVVVLTRMGWLAADLGLGFWFMVYALSLPFASWTHILTAYLQALKQIKEMARAQLLVKLQTVPLIIGAAWLYGFEGFIIATVVGYALGLWPFLRSIGSAFLNAPRHALPKLFGEMARYSVLSNGVHTLGKHADIYILSLFSQDFREVGFYALAKILLTGANLFTSTMQRLVMPELSEGADDERWFRRQVRRSQIQTIGLSLGVAVLVMGGGWVIVTLLYDPAYAASLTYLGILLLKYVLWSSFAILGIAVMSLGAPRANFIVVSLTTPISLGLTYVLLRTYGTLGVAWAQVAAHAVMLVFHAIALRLVLRKHYPR